MNGGAAHVMLEAASALLQQGRAIDRLSRLLTVAALVLLIGASAVGVASPALAVALALAVLAGVAEAYYAIRVGFDAALFDRLREVATIDLAALDVALVQLGLLSASRSGRSLEQRIAGGQRLFYEQGAVFLIQVAILLCGAATAFMS
ncbi:MAG: hypothetical protein QOH32_4483 [Bradyrhizobium sp.]|jgi:hypothetical protein|nr:hypothetical protein [Bradyrhizobium sp.]